LRSALVFTRFEQRLQAITPKHIEADHVVLLFAKAQGDEAGMQTGIAARFNGDTP